MTLMSENGNLKSCEISPISNKLIKYGKINQRQLEAFM